MSRLKQLLHEIHRRSLWQVLSVYIAGSWGVLEAVEMVVETADLPPWVQPLAIVFLLLGLPMVAATAIIQHGVHGLGGGEVAAKRGAVGAPTGRPETTTRDARYLASRSDAIPRRLFTWRNTIIGGLVAMAIWGLIAAGWFAGQYFGRDRSVTSSVEGVRLAAGEGEGSEADAPAVPGDSAASGPESKESAEAARSRDQPVGAEGGAATPPPSPRAATPMRDTGEGEVRAAYLATRGKASHVRETVRAMDAQRVRPQLVATADSLWNAAEDAAAAGRYAEAGRRMQDAGDALRRAQEEASAEWRRRLDAARGDLAGPKAAADIDAPAYAEGLELEREAAQKEEAGDYATALAALSSAADAFRRAAQPPEPRPVGELPPGPESPEAIVAATLARLERALAAEDLDAVRSVWVSLSSTELENFRASFEQWNEIRVTFAPIWSTLVQEGGQIQIAVETTWRYRDGRGRPHDQTLTAQMLRLGQQEGRWVIVGR